MMWYPIGATQHACGFSHVRSFSMPRSCKANRRGGLRRKGTQTPCLNCTCSYSCQSIDVDMVASAYFAVMFVVVRLSCTCFSGVTSTQAGRGEAFKKHVLKLEADQLENDTLHAIGRSSQTSIPSLCSGGRSFHLPRLVNYTTTASRRNFPGTRTINYS
jgi:hypothetical protein